MLNPDRKWLSFYIFLPAMDNVFLTEHLPEIIYQLRKEKLIRRFFFIRYGEGGYHIRLRILPKKSDDGKFIEKKIRENLQSMKDNISGDKAAEIRLEITEYDRVEHYFGESLKTVYSELINEQTSILALRLLTVFADLSQPNAVKILPSLYILMSESARDERDFQTGIEEGIHFVLNSGYYDASKNDPAEIPSGGQEAVVKALIGRTKKSFQNLPEIERAAKLLRRCKRNRAMRFAATHSIHIYLNKMNFSMSQELKLYRLLQKMPFDI